MLVSQLSIFAENKPGILGEITKELGKADIDIRAMSIADSADFGIFRLIVNDIEKAKKALTDAGFVVSETKVLAVAVPDTPGALTNMMTILSENGINIEYMYAFVTASKQNAYVVLRVMDSDMAIDILTKNNIKLICNSDIKNF